MSKVIITGASGYVGSHLVPLLLDYNFEVTAFVKNLNNIKKFDWFKKIDIYEFDFSNPSYPINILNFDSLIHLAWVGLPNYNSSVHIDINYKNSKEFLNYFLDKGIKKILVAGTCFEYGLNCSGAISSSQKPSPNTLYAIAKNSLREDLSHSKYKYDFILQWARLFYSYGDGQNQNSLYSQLNRAILNKESYFDISNGNHVRDYLPISKLVEQLLTLFLSNKDGVFNICSGMPKTISELVQQLANDKNSSIKFKYGKIPSRDYEPSSFWGIRDVGETFYIPSTPNSVLDNYSNQKFAPVRLRYNTNLNFLDNEAFNLNLIDYSINYDNNQSFSLRFQEHLINVLNLLKSNYKKGSRIVEIGCGKGSFLEIVQNDKYFEIFGYDEAYDGINPSIQRRYLDKTDRLKSDLIVLRHVLEHIAKPYEFLFDLRQIFGSCDIYIEVPDYDWIIRNQAFFDITYEHVNYFSQFALKSLFLPSKSKHGLLFDGQYQFIIANLSNLDKSFLNYYHSNNWRYLSFNELFPQMIHKINKIYHLSQSRSSFLWGAGTKGCLFLSHCHSLNKLPKNFKFAIDINPNKIGKILPGSLIKIKSKEDFLNTVKSGDLLIITNPNYKEEIINYTNLFGINNLLIESL